MGWWPSVMTWTSATPQAAKASERVLLHRSGATCTVADERVGPTERHTMHSITTGAGEPAIVCMPGYAAGAAFFYRNLCRLSAHATVHCVDWLGTGVSGRPNFPCRTREEAEDWFIDALDTWRKRQGIEKMVLVGHSLGGYLSATYALKYPAHVAHLILVNPAGMACKDDSEPLPEIVRSPFSVGGMVYRIATRCWHAGVTPGTVVRTLGPLGRRLTRNYAERRLHRMLGLEMEEVDAFEPYLYQILGGRGSGEHALRLLLKPFAWANSPMEERMDKLQPPITFIYGEHDWMDPAAGKRICKRLAARSVQPSAVKHQNEVYFIADTSHFPFLEKPQLFDELLLNVVSDHLRGGEAEAPPPNDPEHEVEQLM